MNTQHHNSFTKAILGSTQRLFRSKRNHTLLANHHIDAHTMRDIGINPIELP
jgi:hypothetical protein